MEYLVALNAFCLQLNEFCLLFQREILQNADVPVANPSAALAQGFAETLILCPTGEAASASIRRDPSGARSFLMAADGVLRKIRTRPFQFTKDCPVYQTHFYLLACGVTEFLEGIRPTSLPDSALPQPCKLSPLPS